MDELTLFNSNMTELQREAVETHYEIRKNAEITANALVDFCKGLKKMRDKKLYAELGCETFEEYAKKFFGLAQRQAYNYIQALGNLGEPLLQSNANLGITKLMSKYKSQLGQRVHDCVGLIKGYLWSESATAAPEYKKAQDVSANGMRSRCKVQGKIATLPEIPGVLVFMSGHVGVYIGNGKVIEARGFNYGVVETNLEDRKWTSWGKCPWIKYPSNENFFKACDKTETSLVDALKRIGVNSSFANRKKIAVANGIADYSGTAKQNIKLLNLLKQGKLVKP